MRPARRVAGWQGAGAGVVGFLAVLAGTALAGVAFAAFSASTASGSTLSLASLDSWLPTAVSSSRVTSTTCQVSWTPHGSAPVGATYDVTDGTSTMVSDVAGTTTVVTAGAGAVTPVVKLRVGSWVSSSGTAAASGCLGWPDAPVVSLTPSQTQVSATWTAPAGNGSAVVSYAASVSPAGTGTSSCSVVVPAARSCVFTGLTDGVTYTVSVTATNGVGTGPAGTATAIPYPSSVMGGPALTLWLDGADPSTLFASSSCSGAAASATVGCWADKSGNANNATQSTAAQRPALSAVNSRQVPDLDGTDDWLSLDPSLLPTGTAPSTVLVDARLDDADPSNSTHGMIVTWGTASTGQSRGLWKGWYDDSVFASVWAGTGTSQGHWVTGAPQVAVAQHVTPAVTVWANGTGVGATSSVDGPFSTGATAAAVGQFDSSYFWNGAIPEVIVFQSALSDADRRTVEEYLARKWGSTITPQAPTGVTVSPTAAGASADVAWSAPGWNGGSVVTGYTVTAVPTAGGQTITCTAVHPSTSCTLAGLAGAGAQYTVTVTATNAAGTGPTSSDTTFFAGLPVTTNLKLWLDGADSPTLLASSSCSGAAATTTVGCWRDKSGQSDDATQATPGSRPALSTLNGLPAPAFDGSTSVMALDVTKLPSGSADSTIWLVATMEDPSPTTSNHRAVLGWGASANTQTRAVTKPWHSTLAYQDTWGQAWPAGRSWSATGTVFSGRLSSSGPTSTVDVDGAQSYSETVGLNTGSAGGAWLGNHVWGNWAYWQGRIAEVVVVGQAASDAENRQVQEYLARKWGVTITPSAPQAASASAGDATATVSWTAPSWNGGAAITSYAVTPVGGPGSCTWSAGTSASCTGLTNGTPYTFAVAAVNAVGTGPATTTASVTPMTVPGAPTATAAAAGDTTASVSWTAPVSNGGSAISSYTATAVPSDGTLPTRTCSSASSPCSLSGLTNGATYTVSVTATNSAGTGSASTAATLIPYPALLTSANGQLWLDGKDVDGDGTIEGTAESCDTGTTCVAASNVLTRWKDRSGRGHDAVQATTAMAGTYTPATGLVSFSANGYYQASSVSVGPDATAFGVASSAVSPYNAWGWLMGSRSANGWMLHPRLGVTTTDFFGITNAGYNQQTTVTASVSPVTAITNPHIWDGWISGSASQTLNHGVDGAIGTTVASATTRAAAAVTLTIGADDFDLAARRGNGSFRELVAFDRALTASERRSITEYLARKWAVTITPSAPQGASASAGNASATVSWSAPAWDGGVSVSSYTVTPVGGAGSCTWSSGTTASCTGLSNGTSYTFTVAAVNSVGAGPTASTAAVTPYTVPGAPTGVAATADDTVSSVSWSAPASDGGSAITSYTATAVPSDGTLPTRTCSSASSPCSLSGLTDGVTYTVSVTATNAAGAGSASTSTSVIPYPKTIMSGGSFKLWLDGADSATLFASSGCSGATASSAVGCWTDKSGTGNNATQGTGAAQPGLTTVAGRSVPSFDGTSDRLTLTPSLLPTGTAAGTQFAVASTTEANPASSSYRLLMGYGTGNSGQSRSMGKDTFQTAAYVDAWNSGVAQSGSWATGVTSVMAGEFASGQFRVGWAGAPYGAARLYGYNTGTTGAAVGSNLVAADFWMGPISEFLVFSSALSTADQRTVAEYLARKWASTITPSAPQSASATAGNTTATVSWSAPAWNGGANVTSYTVTPVGGAGSCTWSSGTTASCSGLTHGASYTFTVSATNSVGAGPTTTTAAVTP